MSVVLDAYAVIAFLTGETAAAEVEAELPTGVIASTNLAETLDVCIRVHGNSEERVRERLGWLRSGGLEIASLDAALALDAGSLRAKHYHRRDCAVSHGDCVALAVARDRKLPLATADTALAATARAEGVDVVALPDSRGQRP